MARDLEREHRGDRTCPFPGEFEPVRGVSANHAGIVGTGIDLVCTPGGARSRVPGDQPTTRISWEGDRTPEWFEISSRTGEIGRDCELRMSADGLHPLATGLKRTPLLRGPEVGARLIESGRARSALYRVD